MPATPQALKFNLVVNAPPSEVYREFTNASALREWLCDASQAEARKGGRLYLWWKSGYYAVGEFAVLEPGKKVAFTWQGRGEPDVTRVLVSLAAADSGTAVRLTHSGVGSGKAWAKVRDQIARGWPVGLENLKSVMETGMDLRYVMRPMLGVSIGEFTPEHAARLGVPATEGIRLDSTMEGMGAEAAGLQKDDVLVRLGGKRLSGWMSLIAALEAHRAGDRVPVVFYRGPEKRSATLVLSRRPLPEIPPTPDALAEALRAIYARLILEVESAFEAASESEVSYRPAAGEWSAKEAVAHLIAGERDSQVWITGLATGEEPEVLPGNFTPRNSAIASVHATLPDLMKELRDSAAETVALLAALPPEIAQRKGAYWKIGHNVLQPESHVREHVKQIRDAIAAARSG